MFTRDEKFLYGAIGVIAAGLFTLAGYLCYINPEVQERWKQDMAKQAEFKRQFQPSQLETMPAQVSQPAEAEK